METVTYNFEDLVVAFRSPRPLAWASRAMLDFGASLANCLRETDAQMKWNGDEQGVETRRLVVNIWYGSA